jgi:hypothetical protein
MATVGGTELVLAAGGGTAVAVTGTPGAERAAGLSPAEEAGRLHRLAAPMGEGTAATTDGERQEGEATMLVAAAMAGVALARVEATPEAGYLPAGPRRTSRTGNPAASAPAAPAAGRSPPAARRTPTLPTAAAGRSATLPPAAGGGRARRIRSPSPAPPARTSTAAIRGRGSAAPRRRPDLPPAAPSRQLSGPRRQRRPSPEARGSDGGASRSRPPRASGARQITPPMDAPPTQATSAGCS